MWCFSRFFKIVPILLLILSGCSAGTSRSLKADGGYVITSAGDAASERWAEYLFTHLSKRTSDTTTVVICDDSKLKNYRNYKVIYLEMANDLKDDYCIEHSEKQLYISFHEDNVALWLIYQLVEKIAEEDSRFQAHDVPSAVIDFTTGCKKFDFVYREPYFAPNLEPDYAPVVGANNVEVDWGLWGHNLAKVAGKMAPDGNDKIYAMIDEARNKEQLCFSSPLLFDLAVEYIRDNYGNGDDKSYRFMIMPEDNNLVCMCPACGEQGNTENDAAPAVVKFVGKLSAQFPVHQFFITAYGTTVSLPKHRLPKNVNVFLSTMDLPKGVELTDDLPEVKEFKRQIEGWKDKTENVYLWDYASNFDDYLTPSPVLYGLQKQLKFFKTLGVKGIFLNASGYDYSPFDDVKTLVSAALMMNVNADVDKLVRKFFKKEYPVSHRLLADYYLKLERDFSSKNIPYNMYGGMRHIVETYLNAGDFVRFYDALGELISGTEMEGTEYEKLQKLHTALSYTRLQVAYVEGVGEWGYADRETNKTIVKPEIKQYVQALEKFHDYHDMKRYKEAADGLLADYVTEWEQLIAKSPLVNELTGIPIKVRSGADEGFTNAGLLNDGTLGFALDYHQGWYLSANDLRVGFPAENVRHIKSIKFRFLNNERHGILPPEKIIVIIDGVEAGFVMVERMKPSGNIVEESIAVDLSKATDIELKFVRKQAKKSVIACDEIVFFN